MFDDVSALFIGYTRIYCTGKEEIQKSDVERSAADHVVLSLTRWNFADRAVMGARVDAATTIDAR